MKIIFYDGDCGLCQRAIGFLSRIDDRKQLHFAPLNGQTYLKNILYLKVPATMETVLYFNGTQLYQKSTAIINCLCDLGGKWKLALFLKIIPLIIRDFFYNLMANHRKKITCFIISRDERFLN